MGKGREGGEAFVGAMDGEGRTASDIDAAEEDGNYTG